MKVRIILLTLFIVFTLFLSSCVTGSFVAPVEIHITPGDNFKQADIAVDADGRSHIVGVVNDRVAYYRTRFGEPPLTKFTMVMSGSGANWKQYNPSIAVLDNGHAYITWVEQRGGTEKYACFNSVPILQPIGGYDKSCTRLEHENDAFTTGKVFITAKGDTAYAVYDRIYTDGRTSELWYRRLAPDPLRGRVHWFTEALETAKIHSLALGIDDDGYLHVGYHYNWLASPVRERLELRSNRSTSGDNEMAQVRLITSSEATDETVPVDLAFYYEGSTQRVALTSVDKSTSTVSTQRVAVASMGESTSRDRIYISSCTANGCNNYTDLQVPLPSSWDTFSVIKDVKILGDGSKLKLAFIGDDNTSPTGVEQVYYRGDAFGSTDPVELSSGSATFKFDVELGVLETDSAFDVVIVAWGESNLITNQIFFRVGPNTYKIHENTCGSEVPSLEIGTFGQHVSGVWAACNNTLFTTHANINYLPIVIK